MPSVASATTNPLPDDAVEISSFHVGHGDCTLLEYKSQGCVRFRLLADAGERLPKALLAHLRENPRPPSEPDLDVVVLSHVDADHQGGLPELLQENVTIGRYLGPFLPAFRRLAWLFEERVRNAVERAKNFQDELVRRSIPITFPFEGYHDRHADGKIVISVVSPAARVIKRLATAAAAEISNMLTRQPAPLMWLLESEPEPEPEDDFNAARQMFEGRVMLTPDDLQAALPPAPNIDADDVKQAARENAGEEFEPEYFGNAVLNDTSLVLIVDCLLGGNQRRRIVLCGDQENWSYIAAMHPAGLGIDVLKAPHHGGRVYLDDREVALHRLYAWLRPRVVFVSANGRHRLPRVAFRDALLAVGSTLLCPNRRGIEPLMAGVMLKPDEPSCFAAYGCSKPVAAGRTTITLRADTEFADDCACVQGSGHRGLAPIVVLKQSVVSPSEAFVRWTRGEMEKHGNWIKRQLGDISRERLQRLPPTARITTSIQHQPVAWSSIEAIARAEGRHSLVADPEPVFAFGRSQRLFWKSRRRHYGQEVAALYRLPSETELSGVSAWVASIPNVVLGIAIEDRESPHAFDPIALLQRGQWTVLSALVAADLFVPMEVVTDEILPRLLLQLSKQFEASVSKPLPCIAGHRVLHLTNIRNRVAMPNLCALPWPAVWTARKINESVWESLRKHSETAALLPDCVQSDNEGKFAFHTLWLEHVGLTVEKYSGSRVTCDEANFPAWFAGLGWQSLW